MERLLRPEEVAEILGYSRAGLYQAVHHKRIPAVKISKKLLRFRREDIENWLKTKMQAAEQPKLPVRHTRVWPRRARGRNVALDSSIIQSAKKEILGKGG